MDGFNLNETIGKFIFFLQFFFLFFTSVVLVKNFHSILHSYITLAQ